ncbi:MAG TPA: hypothetical protein DIC60_07570 [Lachnospiraceae bacterium]|nr:hypothetical protein [Lachnospiraceae bacterium]
MQFLIVTIIVTIIISRIIISKIKVEDEKFVNKFDRIGKILNIGLSVFYIPFSLFSMTVGIFIWDSPIKNELDKSTRTIVSNVSLPMPLICIASIVLSVILRKNGLSKLSFFVQFLPIVIFMLVMSL